MRIALVLKEDAQDSMTTTTSQAVIFNVVNNKVVGVENETLESQKIHNLSVWAVCKKINQIYVPEVNESLKNMCNKIGVVVDPYEELNNNQLFKNYII
ncbi:MAG: hypothetical protein LUG96_08495 [Tannerellaceae bacterium]|nr:hypothetical protein [Tannerellaceae bacterium]MCC8199976.1 hypothetical protein [Tannerellaceae bacterium]MCD7711739.1 hypothetical protein [Bacillota bacterium]MCD7915276.1 hypothetical protein [Tannerellaceae bacterium]